MNILSYKNIVKQLLEKHTHLRDNDHKLISNIWHKQLISKGIKPKEYSAYQMLEYFSTGQLANPESIRRIRQKLQEEFPELRGEKYKSRHKATDSVKKQLYETPELYQGGTP